MRNSRRDGKVSYRDFVYGVLGNVSLNRNHFHSKPIIGILLLFTLHHCRLFLPRVSYELHSADEPNQIQRWFILPKTHSSFR